MTTTGEYRVKIAPIAAKEPLPKHYPVLGTAGYRRLVVHKNYSVLFVIIGQTVEVRHILHNKREWNIVVDGNLLKSPD